MKEYITDIIKLLIYWGCRLLSCVFYLFPIKKNRVTFVSYRGAQYSCNPKVVSEYILRNCADQFEVIWGLDDPASYDGPKGSHVRVVKHGSLAFYKLLCTSRFIVTNVDYLSYIKFRSSQIIVQTWHGGGSYKRVGNQTKNINWFVEKRRSYFNEATNYFISSSQIFTKDTIKGSFHFKGKILNIGMPRNDIFFQENPAKAAAIKKKLRISENKHLLLYAPTYKNFFKDTTYELDEKRLKAALSKRFGGEWEVLYRLHPMLKDTVYTENLDVINVSSYNDMQELLYVSDILITDYSSSMWDFSHTNRPCFLFVTDLQEYQSERDFYTDIHTWPFILAQNNDELEQKVLEYDANKYRSDVEQYLRDCGNYENGTACKKLVELMISKL